MGERFLLSGTVEKSPSDSFQVFHANGNTRMVHSKAREAFARKHFDEGRRNRKAAK
jgi:hypothetical protein